MVALHEREKSGMGQELDVALFEPVFRIMEFTASL
jgi:crotonobetainyl-CoA:carnitine CoA-transferase CaiB-like acyl-CoA transferase